MTKARSWLALAMAVTACAIAVWSIIPPPTYTLLVIAIAAPEIAAWLIAIALLAALLAIADARRRRVARLALTVAGATLVLAALPFLRFPSAHARCDAALRRALGDDFLAAVPAQVRDGMRRAPLAIGELLMGLRPPDARVERGIVFASPGAEPLTLDVYRPPSDGRFPAIVQIYGGAWRSGSPADNAAFARYFAAHGYVVFAIDHRHAPGAQWPAQLDDVRAALAWIVEHAGEYGADATRLALMGRSSGAQLAMIAAYADGAVPVSAVVDYYGPVDLALGYREPPRPDPLDVRSVEEAFLGGAPEAVPDAYRDASPIGYATHPLPPTLLVYGGRDNVVEPRFGALLHARLRASGTTSVLLEIPWAEHAFDTIPFGASAQLALYHTERFLAWALYGR